MRVTDMVVKDIIDLKIEADNIQEDATVENMYQWYGWAFLQGHIDVVYKYGELQGFAEWIRLPRVPKTREDVHDMVSAGFNTGRVIYVANCCVRDDNKRHGTLWKLFHTIKEKNEGYTYMCWHEGEEGTLKMYENNEGEDNES